MDSSRPLHVQRENLLRIERLLIHVPPLDRIFSRAFEELCHADPIGVGVKGSLASGPVDRYSDLDFVVILPVAEVSDGERRRISARIEALGQPLATFAATHLGLPNIICVFLEVGDWVVKVDVDLSSEQACLDKEVVVLAEREADCSEPPVSRPDEEPDFSDLYAKFCGWCWFTYTKVARGEFMEAASSLNIMREEAILPSIHYLYSLPRHGYRRLERNLPRDTVEELYSTYPRRLTRSLLFDALLRQIDYFKKLQEEIVRRRNTDHRFADLAEMRRLVIAAETNRDPSLGGSGSV